MSDEEYFEQLCSNSIDGTLTDAEREKLEAHLAECPSCAALKQDLERMQALFAEEVEPPAGLHENIMQRLEHEGGAAGKAGAPYAGNHDGCSSGSRSAGGAGRGPDADVFQHRG